MEKCAPRAVSTSSSEARVGLRLTDSSANPYLATAAVIAAGLDGIDRQLLPGAPQNFNHYTMSTEELRRRGWVVNPKRVRRLMREDNLLCVRKRKFVVTTDSNHGRRIYPNLAGKMILTDTDQLWVSDTTYIRLRDEVLELANSIGITDWLISITYLDEIAMASVIAVGN